MSKTNLKTVDDYIDAQPAAVRGKLVRLRKAIVDALPGADESISYGMPTYKLGGKRVLYFAVWKDHFALYGSMGRVAAELKDELAAYKTAKGTIRFPLAEAVPLKLIDRIARLRAEEIVKRH